MTTVYRYTEDAFNCLKPELLMGFEKMHSMV
jgi:hypothetical protein